MICDICKNFKAEYLQWDEVIYQENGMKSKVYPEFTCSKCVSGNRINLETMNTWNLDKIKKLFKKTGVEFNGLRALRKQIWINYRKNKIKVSGW